MSTAQERTPQTAVIRHFEPSRHGSANLAAAFERALPTIGCAVSKARTPTTGVVGAHRTARAVS
jgi:hypothetical protein